MSFSERNFQFYLVFGNGNENNEPWKEEQWKNIYEPSFKQILNFSTYFDKTALRVLEYSKKNKEDQYFSAEKLGKLAWNDKSHEKWVLKTNDDRKFTHFASWTPTWTICEKIDNSPDIYISISNESPLTNESNSQNRGFSFLIIIAIATDLDLNCTEIIQSLSKKINAKRTVFNIRSWGKGKHDETETWQFINSIQDTISYGMYKTENIHDIPFNDLKFEPYWEIIH
ncbi:hypothetical protein [Flavobacterium ginsenosidimutans]|uniref:hypothetical protein n=1 Tax=Flavobacterium ginsenosidimutans TaxID=687844 RepID=UPI000DAD8504|nr:hypothetical protein [Flavobacterium ginsenosidimutans]KAF2335348.1 hypothetical protein DM444_05080 [Flavobacterium ginsenosidimutans]